MLLPPPSVVWGSGEFSAGEDGRQGGGGARNSTDNFATRLVKIVHRVVRNFPLAAAVEWLKERKFSARAARGFKFL